MMKKTLLALSLASTMLFSNAGITNADSTVDDILKLQPDITKQELLEGVQKVSSSTGESEQAILDQMYSELKADQEQGNLEKMKLNQKDKGVSILGGNAGSKIVGSSAKGNFYYTPSETAYLDHGHVGLFYTSTVIVEAVPSAGVRLIDADERKVDSSGAVVKSITASETVHKNATSWARSQVGQSYSYNFVNNRNTDHYGAKNCSKLIWSAYKIYGNLDLDVDKGLGVYPRDVRDAPGTKLVRNI